MANSYVKESQSLLFSCFIISLFLYKCLIKYRTVYKQYHLIYHFLFINWKLRIAFTILRKDHSSFFFFNDGSYLRTIQISVILFIFISYPFVSLPSRFLQFRFSFVFRFIEIFGFRTRLIFLFCGTATPYVKHKLIFYFCRIFMCVFIII